MEGDPESPRFGVGEIGTMHRFVVLPVHSSRESFSPPSSSGIQGNLQDSEGSARLGLVVTMDRILVDPAVNKQSHSSWHYTRNFQVYTLTHHDPHEYRLQVREVIISMPIVQALFWLQLAELCSR